MLYIVPAKVQGTWRDSASNLEIVQAFDAVTGTLTVDGKPMPIADGKVVGSRITFTAGDAVYSGDVNGNRIAGTVQRGGRQQPWSADRRQ
jgi:hypothetical protein